MFSCFNIFVKVLFCVILGGGPYTLLWSGTVLRVSVLHHKWYKIKLNKKKKKKLLFRPLGSVISSLDKRSRVCFPALPWDVSLVDTSHGIYELGVLVFRCPLSIFCPVFVSEETSPLCWPLVVSVFLYVVLRKLKILWHRDKWYKEEEEKSVRLT